MKRILLALVVAIAIAPDGGNSAQAQIAAAIGKPLPSPDMPPGEVSVRVVAGSPSSPVSGTEVTLTVNGTPRIARTDDAGRAIFKDLPSGATVQAKVVDEDKKDITSEEFPLPSDTGVRLMLSTRPWNPGGGGGMAGGAGGGPPMNPRQMSGEPRPEDKDPPGSLTARLSYDDFTDKTPPAGVAVALVGYKADDSVTFVKVDSDKDGRATFTGLDRSGATAYFAMTLLPRGTGVDRLTSTPVVLDPRVGVRLILSGEKRDSTAPNDDDLTKLEKQDNAPPAGKVLIGLEGGVEDTEIRLIDAETQSVVGRVHPAPGQPDPQDIQAGAQFTPATTEAGTLDVIVHGGGGGDDKPLTDVAIKVLPANADGVVAPDAVALAEVQTTDDGKARTKIAKLDKPLVAVITINGKPLSTKPFDLAKVGGQITVEAHWDASGKPQAVFDLVPRPGQVVYAETSMHGNLYRTLPFQPVTDRGTRATLFIFPRLLFTFSITSRIDDEYLAVNGRFELSNNSWIPYAGTDGVMIPLPKGFTGGLVAEMDQQDVAIEPHEGFRIIRPIAPGAKQFHGAFSLPISGGSVHWAMDLPWGAFNSGMEILQVPGMSVETPQGADGQVMTVPQGTYFVMPRIQILPKQSMVLAVHGLPEPAKWRVWVPRIVGVLVVLLIIGGVVFGFVRTKADPKGREARRQQLLDALVTMDKAGAKNPARRDELVKELEALWDEDPT